MASFPEKPDHGRNCIYALYINDTEKWAAAASHLRGQWRAPQLVGFVKGNSRQLANTLALSVSSSHGTLTMTQ